MSDRLGWVVEELLKLLREFGAFEVREQIQSRLRGKVLGRERRRMEGVDLRGLERRKNLRRKDEEQWLGWENKEGEEVRRETLMGEEGRARWRKSRRKVVKGQEKVSLRADEVSLSESSKEGAGRLGRP